MNQPRPQPTPLVRAIMPSPRFFHPDTIQPMSLTRLPEDISHHALRVLRLEPGSSITLFDGNGGEYESRLLIEGRQALAETGPHVPIERELRGNIVLLQGMASGNKMEWVVEKAVELGVSALYPIAADRSVLKLDGRRLEKRLEQWRAIVRSASEQCGRNRLMQIHEPGPLRHHLPQLSGHTLFCDPDGELGFRQRLDQVDGQLNLLVGPEGGWSGAEVDLARQAGLQGVRFGARILRTETAGLALVAAATALLDW